jgi:WD40 repeat protein
MFVGLLSGFVFPDGEAPVQASTLIGDRDGTIADQLTAEIAPLLTLDPEDGKLTAVAFSPDNQTVAAATENGMVYLWQVSDGSLIHALEGHTLGVNDLAFSPDGATLASASDDRSVRLWDVESGELDRRISTNLEGRALEIEYSPDGSLLTIGGNFCYVLARIPDTGILRRSFNQPGCTAKRGGSVTSWGLEFSPDGSLLVTGEGQPGGSGGSIQIWDVDEYTRPQLVRGYDLVVRDLSIAPDASTIAVALVGSPEIWLLDTEDGSTIMKLDEHKFRVNSVEYSPDGALLISGSRDGTVRLWDTSIGFPLRVLDDHTDGVSDVAFSPDGSLIASASEDGTVIVWGVAEE